eukprot:CAMPEP_0114334722 /NCGR_PEP_ID=MMETSP0101-20121206/4573_1 /TAXON_ID=38822 ORGANISM="Pteridomonas danica, Strain PT" /NCGR_SAMPLE_ID=MMETSP0101 /ASSEMBLY_ACC=CAM_ASM_000211 /LENGTH=41 /DNA_ID= /DNA_START= /DNA_END= /DNA_ORIENTATION=
MTNSHRAVRTTEIADNRTHLIWNPGSIQAALNDKFNIVCSG